MSNLTSGKRHVEPTLASDDAVSLLCSLGARLSRPSPTLQQAQHAQQSTSTTPNSGTGVPASNGAQPIASSASLPKSTIPSNTVTTTVPTGLGSHFASTTTVKSKLPTNGGSIAASPTASAASNGPVGNSLVPPHASASSASASIATSHPPAATTNTATTTTTAAVNKTLPTHTRQSYPKSSMPLATTPTNASTTTFPMSSSPTPPLLARPSTAVSTMATTTTAAAAAAAASSSSSSMPIANRRRQTSTGSTASSSGTGGSTNKGSSKGKDTTAAAAAAAAFSGATKNHQLPMFLSKTYHMIDKCDPAIATWSPSGDSFVVKNVEMFSGTILPMYFKHSNFSSFARQLNFYGFRKLRADPILTNDVDPSTSGYVRFYHEKFQQNRPDLLHQIKRATKSAEPGQGIGKDEVDSLRAEVGRMKECITAMSCEMDRKLAEMTFDYNHRIANLTAENERLSSIVMSLWDEHKRRLYEQVAQAEQQVRAEAVAAASATAPPAAVTSSTLSPPPPPTSATTLPSTTPLPPTSSVAAAAASSGMTISSESLQAARNAERRMHSLSQAVTLNLSQPGSSYHNLTSPAPVPSSSSLPSTTTPPTSHHISSILHSIKTAGAPTSVPGGIANSPAVGTGTSSASPLPPHSSTAAGSPAAAAAAAAVLNSRHQQVLAAAAAAEAAAVSATAAAEAGISGVRHDNLGTVPLAGTKRKMGEGNGEES